MLNAVSLSVGHILVRAMLGEKEVEEMIGLVPIIFLMNGPSHMSAEIQSWDCRNVCKGMSYQDSGDCSMEPSSLFSFAVELDLR